MISEGNDEQFVLKAQEGIDNDDGGDVDDVDDNDGGGGGDDDVVGGGCCVVLVSIAIPNSATCTALWQLMIACNACAAAITIDSGVD